MKRPRKIFSIIFILALIGLIFVWLGTRTIKIENQIIDLEPEQVSSLSGLACDNYQARAFAIALAADPVTRPLAGLSQADFVFEMPVITGSITRLLAVYQCEMPDEIGSLRSARHDFIPLAMGLDAILVHWGGSHFALDQLNVKAMDNLDALKNPYNAFYQKSKIPQPHNGFSSRERLLNSAEKLGYRMENEFEGYLFQIQNSKFKNQNDNSKFKIEKRLKINYTWPYNVEYEYDVESNSYLRSRAGKPEMDKNNNQQIKAKNIVVLEAFSRQIQEPDYNDLDIEGMGFCQVFQNGQVISCTWHKDKSNPASKLYFLDKNKEEIPFVPGQTWIEIVEPSQKVEWLD